VDRRQFLLLRRPLGPPDPSCIRQRRFPVTAGDRNTTDMISSHIEAVRAAMKAVAHEGAPTAAYHVAIPAMGQALQ
jgi:hypothetical protein